MSRNVNTVAGNGHLSPVEIEAAFLASAHTRLFINPIDKNFFYAFLAGFWVALGAHAGSVFAGGIPVAVRTAWPILPKLGVAITFPLALNMIVLFGGQLFTGDCMCLLLAWYRRKTPLWRVAYTLTVDYFGNFAGALFFAFFFSKLTQTFADEPLLSYVQSVAVTKTRKFDFGVLLLRAIPANMMVCLATYLAMGSRDAMGKAFNLAWPPYIFVIGGYEHVVANQFFVSLGLLYHADSTVGHMLFNQAAVGIGNFIGGGLFMAGAMHASLHWRTLLDPERDDPEILPSTAARHQFGAKGSDFAALDTHSVETAMDAVGVARD